MDKFAYQIISLLWTCKPDDDDGIYDHLKAIGYKEMPYKISEHDLYRELCDEPGCARQWYNYSMNKKKDGWYFKPDGNGKFMLGFDMDGEKKEFLFDDFLRACAAFIKLEMDTLISVERRMKRKRAPM